MPACPFAWCEDCRDKFRLNLFVVALVVKALNDCGEGSFYVALYHLGKLFLLFCSLKNPDVVFCKRLECAYCHLEGHGVDAVLFAKVD